MVKTVVAMFVAVWLNMAIQPCLMAAEPLMPDQHQHGDCSHCPDTSHCQDEGRCSFIETYDFDGRAPTGPDVSSVALAAPVFEFPRLAIAQHAGRFSVPVDSGPDPGPPLYVRHCSYLN